MATTNAMDGALASVAEGGTGAATLTANNVILGNGASAVQFVAPGTSGNLLTSNGTTWTSAAAAGGSELVLLATATASSSSTLDFTSLITSSYNYYIFQFSDLLMSASAILRADFSTNNGSTYAATINSQLATLTVGGNTAPSYTSSTSTPIDISITDNSSAQTGYAVFSTSNVRGALWNSYIVDAYNSLTVRNCYAFYNNAGSPTIAIRFLPSTGNFTSGKIYLYGIKNT